MRGNMATFGALTEAQWAEIAQNSTVAETDPASGTSPFTHTRPCPASDRALGLTYSPTLV